MATVNIPTVDPQSAIGAARTVAGRIEGARERARFEALPDAELDKRVLTNYPALLAAAATAATEYEKVITLDGGKLIPMDVIEKAVEIRTRLFDSAHYLLKHIEDVRKQLDAIRAGTGYKDLAADLVALVAIHQTPEYAAILAGDPLRRADDLSEAMRLAGIIQAARIDVTSKPAKKAAEKWAKAFEALRAAHDEICATGRWLDRKSEDPSRYYPSLYTRAVSTGGKKKDKKEKPKGPPTDLS